MTLVAGVDSSTQSCKVVVRDLETGAVVRSGRASHPEGTEVDPAAWWDALLAALADAGGLDDVAAISVGAQQHGMVVLDDAGRVIRPALLWNDTRSAGAALQLIDELGAAALAERTGSVPVASFTLTKLRWLWDNERANAERVAAVALPHDWLSWRLMGYGPEGESPLGPVLEALTTDRSDASGTSYFNAVTDKYDRPLLDAAFGNSGLGLRVVLPTVVAPGARAGTVGDLPEFPKARRHGGGEIVVGAGAGDNAGAALGLGASTGDVVVSIGTSGTVFAVTDVPTSDATGTVAGFADATGSFLPLVATLNAARVLDAVAGLLGVGHDELGALALEVGLQHQAARAGRRPEGEFAQFVVPDAEQAGHRVEHARRVQRRDQGQEAAGGVREAGDRAGGVVRRHVGDGEDRAAGADGDHHVAGRGAEPERGARVVARSGADDDVGAPAPFLRKFRKVADDAGAGSRRDHGREHDAMPES